MKTFTDYLTEARSIADIIKAATPKKDIKKQIKAGFVFMVVGLQNDKIVDRRFAKTLEDANKLEKIVSGTSATMRLKELV